jgi:hypothetical protein
MFWGRVFWIFWIMWFFPPKYKYRFIIFLFDLRMINMSSECEYDWYWKISACSTEYEVCDSFPSLARHQTSYSVSTGWYFRYQSIHIQITYTYHPSLLLYLPADSISKTRINVRVSWAGLISNEQELSPNYPNI